MSDLFGDLSTELEFCSTERIEPQKKRFNHKRKMALLERGEFVKNFIEDINEGEQLMLVSNENFGSIELLQEMVRRYEPTEMLITTWSINDDFIDLMRNELSKGTKITFNVDQSLRGRKHHLWAQVANLAYDYKTLFKVKLHDLLHAKVTIMKTPHGHFSIESSANYSKNQRIEQFCITNCEDRYNFNKFWISKI